MAHEGTETVTLTNRLKRLQSYELPHEAVCIKSQICLCSRQLVGWREHDAKTGDRFVRGSRKRVGSTVTLLAKGTLGGGDVITGLPLAVLNVDAIKAAKLRGDIAVDVVFPPKEESTPSAAAAAAPAEPPVDKTSAPAEPKTGKRAGFNKE